MTETADAWKERIGVGRRSNLARRVGGDGTRRVTAVERDDGPGIAGTRMEHWSGRVDATVTSPTVEYVRPMKEHTDG